MSSTCRLGFSSYLSAWDLCTTPTLHTTICGISGQSFLSSHIRPRGWIFSFLPVNICAMTFLCAFWLPRVNKEWGFESQTQFADSSPNTVSALLCQPYDTSIIAKMKLKKTHRIQKVTINPIGNSKLSYRLSIWVGRLGEWIECLNSNCSGEVGFTLGPNP